MRRHNAVVVFCSWFTLVFVFLLAGTRTNVVQSQGAGVGNEGRRLFEEETFGGNGRTCLTCHSKTTGTVSPADAEQRFAADPADPLFVTDGSDDGLGHGVSRMIADATVLMKIPLPPNVQLKDDPGAQFVILKRGIPTTLNTPALDPVLMLDGRQPDLPSQAAGAIRDHAQATIAPTIEQLSLIASFQSTDRFFSSIQLKNFAHGAAPPQLPIGRTPAERRGRRFFEDIPPGATGKDGLCAGCHSGPMLNETNAELAKILPIPPGTRFQSVLVSEFNAAGNIPITFVFTNPDNTKTELTTPDPGRALITGVGQEFGSFDNVNAFKIPTLWGVKKTAPYFHDNHAKTLEAVALHYRNFFLVVTGGGLVLDDQDLADMVAFMKLL
jgi:cytochrome c peroxidase